MTRKRAPWMPPEEDVESLLKLCDDYVDLLRSAWRERDEALDARNKAINERGEALAANIRLQSKYDTAARWNKLFSDQIDVLEGRKP